MGQHKEAYHYAVRHLDISRDTGDRMGQATAQLNIAELSRTLGYAEGCSTVLPLLKQQQHSEGQSPDSFSQRRSSMERMDLLKLTPDSKGLKPEQGDDMRRGKENSNSINSLNRSGVLDEEDFFDFISRFQSKRMDDQRCSLTVGSLSNRYA